ncbi:hypothetical protein FOQG_19307, partial [Fusarium oxysporum f. sp. raphani 54005]
KVTGQGHRLNLRDANNHCYSGASGYMRESLKG